MIVHDLPQNDTHFKYRTYRVEWHTIVAEVDQYETEMSIIYRRIFKTQEDALSHLETISKPHQFVAFRRVAIFVPHEYHRCYVKRLEVLVDET